VAYHGIETVIGSVSHPVYLGYPTGKFDG
jgi:hypothetical protein